MQHEQFFIKTIDFFSDLWYNVKEYGVLKQFHAFNIMKGLKSAMDTQFTVMKTGEEVRARIREMASEINRDYAAVTEENPLLVLCTLRGAVFFAADLVRALSVPCELDFIKIKSYEGTRPAGSPIFELGEQIKVAGRDVLIVEDIVDTGQTMDTVMRNFSDKGAVSIRIASMLDKPSRRYQHLQQTVAPDYIGFSIPDEFVIGWGLDYNDRFRLLPDIMIYHP